MPNVESPIDLRSDTVTRPTRAMRDAMANAEVGDDVFGEDPTVKRLEARVAEILGKEAALFVPSGTMSNQIAILCHTNRGDELYAGEGSHCIWYESGASAAWSGVQLVELGKGGLFDAADLEAGIKARAYWCPNPRLCVVENTHNRAGGKIFPADTVARIAEVARNNQLALHLDGARIWNAAAATGLAERELALPFDTVSVSFAKGLGAPIGSALAGTRALIERAHRFRKMLGGGMRQVGIIAAGALYGLEHHRARLADDHAAARAFTRIANEGGLKGLSIAEPETNIVMVDLETPAGPIATRLAERGVLTSAFGPKRLRVVTHLDVSLAAVERAARVLVEVIGAG